ncbi:MAG: hexitol phosphatase HxpB [Bacteroidia bacterium]
MEGIKAVIFDMDGVIIDSEPLWRRAMIKGFTDIGLDFTDDDCRKTTGMRFKEVVLHWFAHHAVKQHSPEELHDNVIRNLVELVRTEGNAMNGTLEALQHLKQKGLLIGLATSSSHILMDTVLDKLNIHHFFSTITSAEFLEHGKPHPEVFLNCAKGLKAEPHQCMVIEDSVNGIIAAKAAQMQVAAIPDAGHSGDPRLVLADYRFNNLHEFIKLF